MIIFECDFNYIGSPPVTGDCFTNEIKNTYCTKYTHVMAGAYVRKKIFFRFR